MHVLEAISSKYMILYNNLFMFLMYTIGFNFFISILLTALIFFYIEDNKYAIIANRISMSMIDDDIDDEM